MKCCGEGLASFPGPAQVSDTCSTFAEEPGNEASEGLRMRLVLHLLLWLVFGVFSCS